MLPALLTTMLLSSHAQIFAEIEPLVADIDAVVTVCVEDDCQTYMPTRQIHLQGNKDLDGLGGNNVSNTVGAIVSAVGKSAGAGGRVSVSYSTNVTKKDGTTEKTDIKVEVTVGTGAAAAGATGN